MADLSDFMDAPPSRDLSKVTRLAERAVSLEKAVDALEADLKARKTELLSLRREQLPDAMAECGLSEFKLENGDGVKITNFAHGTLPKTPLERTFALRLLEEHGGDALIKNELTVRFEKKDHNRAVALQQELKAAGYDAELESTVHHMQLAAWCKEKVREGERLDFEKLGVYVGPETKISIAGRDNR